VSPAESDFRITAKGNPLFRITAVHVCVGPRPQPSALHCSFGSGRMCSNSVTHRYKEPHTDTERARVCGPYNCAQCLSKTGNWVALQTVTEGQTLRSAHRQSEQKWKRDAKPRYRYTGTHPIQPLKTSWRTH